MKTIIIDIEGAEKAKELWHILQEMKFVKRVSMVEGKRNLVQALEEHETLKSAIVKRKNKAIEKYL